MSPHPMPTLARAAGFFQAAAVTRELVAINQRASRMMNNRDFFPTRMSGAYVLRSFVAARICLHHLRLRLRALRPSPWRRALNGPASQVAAADDENGVAAHCCA